MSVVFPDPLPPTIAVVRPFGMVRLSEVKTCFREPYRKETFSKVISPITPASKFALSIIEILSFQLQNLKQAIRSN